MKHNQNTHIYRKKCSSDDLPLGFLLHLMGESSPRLPYPLGHMSSPPLFLFSSLLSLSPGDILSHEQR